jgi:hypothetical protein
MKSSRQRLIDRNGQGGDEYGIFGDSTECIYDKNFNIAIGMQLASNAPARPFFRPGGRCSSAARNQSSTAASICSR